MRRSVRFSPGFEVKQIGFAGFFASTSLIGVRGAAACLLLWAKQAGAVRPEDMAAVLCGDLPALARYSTLKSGCRAFPATLINLPREKSIQLRP